MRPNPSLEPTRYGRRRLAAPGAGANCPSAAERRLPPQAAQLKLQGLPHWVNHAAAVIESRSDSSRNQAASQITAAVWVGEDGGQGCGLEELQTVIDAASMLQTLMQDAHGGLIR